MSDETNSAAEDDWADALAEQSEEEVANKSESDGGEAVAEQTASDVAVAEAAPLENLDADAAGITIEDASLEVILDIPVTISLEVGSAKISIRNLLKLNQGSVVELDRLAGEPLDVLVNGTLIAHAEVVVVNERYGIRLTDVISAEERIKKLK